MCPYVPTGQFRITSYNVCYTKLLRTTVKLLLQDYHQCRQRTNERVRDFTIRWESLIDQLERRGTKLILSDAVKKQEFKARIQPDLDEWVNRIAPCMAESARFTFEDVRGIAEEAEEMMRADSKRPGNNSQQQAKKGGGNQEKKGFRITSYNVCYTKLLRSAQNCVMPGQCDLHRFRLARP